MADLPDEINGLPKRKYLFQLDCEHMDWYDAVLFLFDDVSRMRALVSSLAIRS